MPVNHRDDPLRSVLTAEDVNPCLIDDVLDSGFFLNDWQCVGDSMYGNKQFSSCFEVHDFIKYISRTHAVPQLPPLARYQVTTIADILEILAETRRTHYITEGSLAYRGQPREYHFKRKVPNPVRRDDAGHEVSLLPGLYRQKTEYYSFAAEVCEENSFNGLLRSLEPNNPHVVLDSAMSYDIMRTEQHYAKQTAGLDITFELSTALFFATHQFKWTEQGRGTYEPIAAGQHNGVIYCIRFRDPPVKRTEYLIRGFDLFKSLPPLRILRQDCGMPYIGRYERNIAVTDVDCIIHLHPHFVMPQGIVKEREYMFPSVSEDKFYERLLDIKERYPRRLEDVVEYEWARSEISDGTYNPTSR